MCRLGCGQATISDLSRENEKGTGDGCQGPKPQPLASVRWGQDRASTSVAHCCQEVEASWVPSSTRVSAFCMASLIWK